MKARFVRTVLIADGKPNTLGDKYNINEITAPAEVPIVISDKTADSVGTAHLMIDENKVIADMTIDLKVSADLTEDFIKCHTPAVNGYIQQIDSDGNVLDFNITSVGLYPQKNLDKRIKNIG